MKRREFVVRVGSLAVWLPASRFLVACGESNEADEPRLLTFTSSDFGGHSHQVGLEVAIIEAPPPSGTQPTTSAAAGHVHTVSLTEDDLKTIRANQTVTKKTNDDATAHSHTFTFRRSAGTRPGGATDYEPGDGY